MDTVHQFVFVEASSPTSAYAACEAVLDLNPWAVSWTVSEAINGLDEDFVPIVGACARQQSRHLEAFVDSVAGVDVSDVAGDHDALAVVPSQEAVVLAAIAGTLAGDWLPTSGGFDGVKGHALFGSVLERHDVAPEAQWAFPVSLNIEA